MLATSTPMAPRPITPSVLPDSSGPAKRLLFFSTSFSMSGSAARVLHHSTPSVILREASSRPATTSSLTALALAPGELKTTTPFSAILSRGMLFTPAPARPMHSSSSSTDISCKFALRTSSA